MANTAGRAADQFMDSPVVETVRSNPIPAVMIGIGTAWLLMKGRGDAGRNRGYRNRRESSGYRPEWRVASSAGYEADTAGAIGTTGATGSTGYGTTTGYGASGYGSSEYGSSADYSGEYGYPRSSGFSLERVARENPLALGAAAALVGVAIGLTVPATDTEDRLMGETRDNVVDKAREVAGDAVEKVQDAAQSAANVAGSIRNEVTPNTESESRTTTRARENTRGKL